MATGPACLHWFTSDLRLGDNRALALAPPDLPVAGVFVLNPESLARAAAAWRRVGFLRACLAALDRDLAARGSRLLVLAGDPAAVLPRAAERLGARVVTHARNVEPGARRREARVRTAFAYAGIPVHATDAYAVQPPGSVRTGAGGPYLVYSAFARSWEQIAVPDEARAPARWVPARVVARAGAVGIDTPVDPELPPAGSAAAADRLDAFLRTAVGSYPSARDLPAVDGTSRLSPHLRFGTISAAACVRRARAVAQRDPRRAAGVGVWVRELAWRDFFAHLLAAEPRLADEPLRPTGIRWRDDADALARWQAGTTGYPLVDAGMRELAATGFMHNRVRMVVGSFLTRHLLLDWRHGERHFMAHLLDGVMAQNNGNWQWVAGTGADAQPFHRIFSPVRQGERFDPEGAYVKRWVPELARVPARAIHQPWTLPPLERFGFAPDYPEPIVDLAAARERALAAARDARRRRAG